MSRVLVTGSTGFLATHIVDQLIRAGYNVRGTVRSEAKRDQVGRRWASFGPAFEAQVVPDLASSNLADVMQGISAVIHVASPFTITFKDAQKELLDPAVKGTQNVLQSAHASGIRRIIVTSSIASVFDLAKGGPRADHSYTPNDWNLLTAEAALSGKLPPLAVYAISKALAERNAWNFASAHPEVQLTTINPTMLYGPPVQSASTGSLNESATELYDLFRGSMAKVPQTPVPFFVDVRDAAMAHVLSLQNDSVIGKRILLSAGTYTFHEVVEIIKRERPALSSRLPSLEGEVDESRLTFARIDTSIAVKDLNMKFIPLKKSVLDTIDAVLKLESKL